MLLKNYHIYIYLSISVSDSSASVWGRLWCDTVVEGLTAVDPLQRDKVSIYWLPATLQGITGSGTLLQAKVEDMLSGNLGGSTGVDDEQRWLFAWVTVAKVRVYIDLLSLPYTVPAT